MFRMKDFLFKIYIDLKNFLYGFLSFLFKVFLFFVVLLCNLLTFPFLYINTIFGEDQKGDYSFLISKYLWYTFVSNSSGIVTLISAQFVVYQTSPSYVFYFTTSMSLFSILIGSILLNDNPGFYFRFFLCSRGLNDIVESLSQIGVKIKGCHPTKGTVFLNDKWVVNENPGLGYSVIDPWNFVEESNFYNSESFEKAARDAVSKNFDFNERILLISGGNIYCKNFISYKRFLSLRHSPLDENSIVNNGEVCKTKISVVCYTELYILNKPTKFRFYNDDFQIWFREIDIESNLIDERAKRVLEDGGWIKIVETACNLLNDNCVNPIKEISENDFWHCKSLEDSLTDVCSNLINIDKKFFTRKGYKKFAGLKEAYHCVKKTMPSMEIQALHNHLFFKPFNLAAFLAVHSNEKNFKNFPCAQIRVYKSEVCELSDMGIFKKIIIKGRPYKNRVGKNFEKNLSLLKSHLEGNELKTESVKEIQEMIGVYKGEEEREIDDRTFSGLKKEKKENNNNPLKGFSLIRKSKEVYTPDLNFSSAFFKNETAPFKLKVPLEDEKVVFERTFSDILKKDFLRPLTESLQYLKGIENLECNSREGLRKIEEEIISKCIEAPRGMENFKILKKTGVRGKMNVKRLPGPVKLRIGRMNKEDRDKYLEEQLSEKNIYEIDLDVEEILRTRYNEVKESAEAIRRRIPVERELKTNGLKYKLSDFYSLQKRMKKIQEGQMFDSIKNNGIAKTDKWKEGKEIKNSEGIKISYTKASKLIIGSMLLLKREDLSKFNKNSSVEGSKLSQFGFTRSMLKQKMIERTQFCDMGERKNVLCFLSGFLKNLLKEIEVKTLVNKMRKKEEEEIQGRFIIGR